MDTTLVLPIGDYLPPRRAAGDMPEFDILPETQFVRSLLRVDTTLALSIGDYLPPRRAAGEMPEFDIQPPFWAPLMNVPRGSLMRSLTQADTSTRQQGFEVGVFPLLDELPNSIEPHLPVCQIFRWNLSLTKWSSPMTKSIYPIVVTTLRVGFPG